MLLNSADKEDTISLCTVFRTKYMSEVISSFYSARFLMTPHTHTTHRHTGDRQRDVGMIQFYKCTRIPVSRLSLGI